MDQLSAQGADNGLPRLVTERELATWLGVHPRTLTQWTREEMFPRPFKLAGGRSPNYWLAEKVEAWATAKYERAQSAA